LDEKAEELRKKKEMQDAINVRFYFLSASHAACIRTHPLQPAVTELEKPAKAFNVIWYFAVAVSHAEMTREAWASLSQLPGAVEAGLG
jgi:hypothetical protein